MIRAAFRTGREVVLESASACGRCREGVVECAALISHRFPLARVAEAMTTGADHGVAIKVVVLP